MMPPDDAYYTTIQGSPDGFLLLIDGPRCGAVTNQLPNWQGIDGEYGEYQTCQFGGGEGGGEITKSNQYS